jgi:hypothetical protein
VRLVAAPDGDATEGTAVLRLGAAGLTEQTVALAITDEGDVRLAPSPEAVTVLAGGTARFGVALSRLPLAPVHVTVRHEGTVVTNLGFDTDSWSAPQMVSIEVGEPGELTVDVEAAGLATAHVRVTVVPVLDGGVADAAEADAAEADAAVADAGPVADAALGDDAAGTLSGSGCGCRVGTARAGARGGASILLLWVGLAAMLRRGPRHMHPLLATGDPLLVRADPASGDAHAAGVPAASPRGEGGHRHRAHGAPGPAELGAARGRDVSGARGARR